VNTLSKILHGESSLRQLLVKMPTLCLKYVTILIVNNFYTLEPILIIFGTLYAEITGF